MTVPQFEEWFQIVCGHSEPRAWQVELANRSVARSQLIRIPTGLGKTEGVLSAWSYHRLVRSDDRWPRRLIWCLPMRVLVEQTYESAQGMAKRINDQLVEANHVYVYQAMGGEELGDWFLHPERPAIIIGTQDMLLSRAMNRGYGSSRARWPVEFGLLNCDALWVMDEVQLMDVGLATSSQIQAYRDQDADRTFRPSYTWWMSATLQPDWLESVDTVKNMFEWTGNPCRVPPSDRTGGLFDVKKSLSIESVDAKDSKGFASLVLTAHQELNESEYGRITLVVCNTVERACATFDQIRAQDKNQEVQLVHSRFRSHEREAWREAFLSKATCYAKSDRIIVATQVVEAGVDVSAGCLISELAPWPSLVQRFGRCARYGGSGRVVVVDRGHDEKLSLPYAADQLSAALEALEQMNDVGIAALEGFEEALSPDSRSRLFPYAPQHLLMRSEFDELFDTTPDLTGADIDISRFIRSGEERDLQVFWVDIAKDASPDERRQPQRQELCAIRFTDAQKWLCGEETKAARKPNLTTRMQRRAWIWDWIDGAWITPKRSDLLPGRIVCVASDRGGYSLTRGFDPASTETVSEVKPEKTDKAVAEANASDSQQSTEPLSFLGWKSIGFHCLEVERLAEEIADQLGIDAACKRLLMLAGKWHDIGKAHPAFQSMLRGKDDEEKHAGVLLAKSGRHSKGQVRYFADAERRDERMGFRHELASALALFEVLRIYQPDHPALLGEWSEWFEGASEGLSASSNKISEAVNSTATIAVPSTVRDLLECSAEEFDLLLYLIVSHHGKVRSALYGSPSDQEYRDRLNDGRGLPIRGIREGDRLPTIAIESESLVELTLTLEPAAMGLSPRTGRSWRERTAGVLERTGPIQLAYLESILRAADVRASQLDTIDPSIADGEPS